MYIKNGLVFHGDAGFVKGDVRIEEGRITAVGGNLAAETGELIDAEGGYVLPGLIDLHTHGARGYDTMQATYAALEGMSVFYASQGVTAFLPTTMTGPISKIVKAVENIRDAMQRGTSGAKILGANMEGPFVNSEYRGAQPEEYILRPTRELVQSLLAKSDFSIKMMVLAPELESTTEILEKCRSQQVVVAIGHSAADYSQAKQAFKSGAIHVTHLFNAMPGLHHREPGLAGAALEEDGVSVEIIADGIHVHPAVIRLVSRCKPADKTVLITDSTMAAGLGDGQYTLGEQPVIVRNGAARLENGALAGSTLTMAEALRNMVHVFQVPLEKAVCMATLAPAKVLGLEQSKGRIDVGGDADLVVMDPGFRVRMTMVEGRMVYRERG